MAQADVPSTFQDILRPAFVKFGIPYTDLPGPDVSHLPESYQNLTAKYAQVDPRERPPLALCFAEGTDPEIVRIVSQVIYGTNNPLDYQAGSRWSTTANGPTGGQGDPITITYSFVPDGVSIPDGIGEGVAPNEIHARLTALFGSEAAWSAKFAQVFARWSELCGVHYVEVNDDGATLFSSPGILGVRGDVRICMKPLDGTYGVLAYNYYPNTGDMVLDRWENWAASANDFRFMRNIVAHEHGHGLGLRHVCPINQTKLMEPYLSTSFDGPCHDDKRGSQRHYGDAYENNNTAAAATNLGTITGTYLVPDASSDDNSDTDWYRFTVGAGQQVSVTLDVIGATYLDGAQNTDGSCSAGTQINSLDDQNLGIRLYDTSGLIVLAEATSQPAGVDEIIPNTALSVPGTYYLQVLPGTADAIQLCDLNIAVAPMSNPVITVSSPNGGEIWVAGAAQTISWNSANLTGDVRIELNRAFPGGTWEALFASTPDDGVESWTPSGASSVSCRVRVTSIAIPAACDSSDENFALITLSPPTDVVIRVISADVILNWTGSGAPNYRIYSAPNSDGPYFALEGTTTSTSFTDVGGASGGALRFYEIVASSTP
jgi:hypothetical protein